MLAHQSTASHVASYIQLLSQRCRSRLQHCPSETVSIKHSAPPVIVYKLALASLSVSLTGFVWTLGSLTADHLGRSGGFHAAVASVGWLSGLPLVLAD